MAKHFQLSDYQFELPPARIAQTPAQDRDGSRLLVAGPAGAVDHRQFRDLPAYVRTGDVLVLNRTRVMKARCLAQRKTGGRVEVFILSIQCDPRSVPVLLRPAKKVKQGECLQFPHAGLAAAVIEKGEEGKATLDFGTEANLHAVIDRDGHVPLPPYIKREDAPSDAARYQTVYADELGAVAAPTAGLHFTDALLTRLRDMGVILCFVTHHVGMGTFKPLTAEDVRDHQMEREQYTMPAETAAILNAAKRERRRIIAVGTTSTRCLESNFDGQFHARTADTGLYIYPGYRFHAIDALITNFHLPGSSLILLVAAWVGRQRILALYAEAIRREYRFYSYGDAMLLLGTPRGDES